MMWKRRLLAVLIAAVLVGANAGLDCFAENPDCEFICD